MSSVSMFAIFLFTFLDQIIRQIFAMVSASKFDTLLPGEITLVPKYISDIFTVIFSTVYTDYRNLFCTNS